jgi:uncharacterized membrane protein SirB2
MDYLLLKHLHIACVVLSGGGFFLRGVWMVQDSVLLRAKWVRVAPHVIDTVLLGSAVALAVVTRQYPWAQSWIAAKIVGLLAYIGLGMVALRRGRSKTVRLGHWLAALLVFGYIVSVALTRDPLGALRWLQPVAASG